MEASEENKLLAKVIHKDLEPGIINDEMIINEVLAGYKGEAGRLARLEPVDLTIVTVLRLEFQKILKIDHLWVLPNLKVLSLAFNKIEKIENLEMLGNLLEVNLSFNFIEEIENLEALTKLEILSLYGNRITELKNVDNLETLLIFSIGDNLIETHEGIERLRFLKNLRSFNMEGNPVALNADEPLRIYIAAFLPSLKYYNYALLTEKERMLGRKTYKLELRELEEKEKTEIKERERRAKERQDEIRLSECFVEYLNDHQLFDSLFVEDPEGDALMSIDTEEVNGLKRTYHEAAFVITQRIYKIGLEQHERRKQEIKLFEKAIKTAREEAQLEGIHLVNEFIKTADGVFKTAKTKMDIVIQDIEKFNLEDSDKNEKELVNISTSFNDQLEKLKKTLMEIEIQLYERIEEANGNFEHIIQDLGNEFIELVQSQFVLLRNEETNFNESLSEAVHRQATILLAIAPDGSELPEPLHGFITDKDTISALALGTRDLHMQRIDAREDRLIKRTRNWVKDLCEKLQRDEVKRNRNKIHEIIYFVQTQREELEKILYLDFGKDTDQKQKTETQKETPKKETEEA